MITPYEEYAASIVSSEDPVSDCCHAPIIEPDICSECGEKCVPVYPETDFPEYEPYMVDDIKEPDSYIL